MEQDGPGAKLEWGALQTYVQDSVEKIRKGVSFYVQGTKLLASDLQVRMRVYPCIRGSVDARCLSLQS